LGLNSQKKEGILVRENTGTGGAKLRGNKAPIEITDCVLRRIGSVSTEVKKEKVLAIRQQLAQRTYDINERLDVALDKILKDFAKA